MGDKVELSADYRLLFWCPGCNEAHGVPVGEGMRPKWEWNGSKETPTIQPSILVTSGHFLRGDQPGSCYCDFEERYGKPAPFKCRRCHSFVEDGKIRFLDDCSHELAGQTVELPEWK